MKCILLPNRRKRKTRSKSYGEGDFGKPVTGLVSHNSVLYQAAIYPGGKRGFTACIMESDIAYKHDTVGKQLSKVKEENIYLSMRAKRKRKFVNLSEDSQIKGDPTKATHISEMDSELELTDIEPRKKTVTFKPGKLGLTADWAIGRVLEVNKSGQSWKKGVRFGWKFHSINSSPYSEQLLDHFISGKKPYKVTFIELEEQYDREMDSISFTTAYETGILDVLNGDFVHHMLTSCLKQGWFKVCYNKFSYIVTGAVNHKNEYFKAAICPAADGKYDVCILDSQLASDRNIRGFRFKDIEKRAIFISLLDFREIKERMRKNVILKHKIYPWDRSCDEREEVAEVWEKGDRVELNHYRWGTVKYAGEVLFAEGIWYGIELDHPTGLHDGKVGTERYFQAKAHCGTMVRPHKILNGKKMEKKVSETQDQSEEESATTTDRTERPLDTLENERPMIKADPTKIVEDEVEFDMAQADLVQFDETEMAQTDAEMESEMAEIAMMLFGPPQEDSEEENPVQIAKAETVEAQGIEENQSEEEIEAKEEQVIETAEREQIETEVEQISLEDAKSENEPEEIEEPLIEEELPPWHSYKILDPKNQDPMQESDVAKGVRDWFERHPEAEPMPPYLPDAFMGKWIQEELTINWNAFVQASKANWITRKLMKTIGASLKMKMELYRLEHNEDRGAYRVICIEPKPIDQTMVYDVLEKALHPQWKKFGLDDAICKIVSINGVHHIITWNIRTLPWGNIGCVHIRHIDEDGQLIYDFHAWETPDDVTRRILRRPKSNEEIEQFEKDRAKRKFKDMTWPIPDT